MNADYGRHRPLRIVLVLFVIAILLDRYLIVGLCPWMADLGGIRLMVVFLDIPVALPQIDPLPVAVLFSLFYSMTPTASPDRQEFAPTGRLSTIWGGVIVLALWMSAGALAYHFAQGLLPRQVRNGIDSFGIHADIHTPFTEYSILPLRGGFILLLCFIIGGRTLVKRVNRTAIARPVPGMILPEAEEAVRPTRPVEPARTVEPVRPARPRVTAKSVAIVAPRRVEVIERESSATPLY
jgi:hypothetical protein